MLAVEDVHFDHLGESSPFFRIYLPISGKARQSHEACFLLFAVMSKFPWSAGARTDKAHFTSKHIVELRKLIEPESANGGTSANEAGISFAV